MKELLNEEKSIYLQICDRIETDILRGVLLEGERVPSTNELARSLHINPATAAKGINELVEQGILYKRRGIGMFVSPGAVQAITAKRRAAFYEQFILPLVAEASSLGLTGTELAAMLEQAAKKKEETT